MTADEVIQKLNLVPLPLEGGFFRECYRTKHSTAIYYLVTEKSFSSLHAVDMDETFHFYAGSPVQMLQIHDGKAVKIIIGNNLAISHEPQVTVPRGIWQGTKLFESKPGDWALLGCTVAPAFEYEHFHIKGRKELTGMFPGIEREIAEFTYAD